MTVDQYQALLRLATQAYEDGHIDLDALRGMRAACPPATEGVEGGAPIRPVQKKYRVECTVTAVVSAASVRELLDDIAGEGWTVFTLLDKSIDKSGTSDSMLVRDYDTNDVLGEV